MNQSKGIDVRWLVTVITVSLVSAALGFLVGLWIGS
jgi:hypothetical protein